MKDTDKIEVDLEQQLQFYMPSMFRLLADRNLKKRQWKKLNKKFVDEHYKRVSLYETNNNYLLVEANFYDLINATMRGEKSAYSLVGYFDILFKALDKNLLPEEKVMVRDTIYSTLIHFDHQFRNFIGELAVLCNAVDKRRYSLLGVEKDTIAQNKTADFTLLDNNTGKKELVEVVNIHLDNSNYLKETLINKLTEKFADKTCNSSDYKRFTLVPVIWAPVAVLQDLRELYKSGNGVAINDINEPVAYCAFSGPNDLPIYRFCPISSLFPEGQIFVEWID